MGMPLQQLEAYLGDRTRELDLSNYDSQKIPTHIAIIMDGNGRWAQSRGLSRSQGHEAGIEGVRAAIRTCSDIGVRYLTIYSFSTENWNRPQYEVDLLMELFANTMAAEVEGLHEEGVVVKLIGDISALPKETKDTFLSAIEKTSDNPGMMLIMAVNYGGQDEIVRAAQQVAQDCLDKKISVEDINKDYFASRLYTYDIPDPDLIIRTSGEFRISNFLLWQSAYSEFYITDVLWPDFDNVELVRAILSYQSRDRRFGKVSNQ